MAGLLLHSPADVIRQLLVDLGACVDYADDRTPWAAFASGEPDLPDSAVTVYDTTGFDEGRVFDGERQEHHGFQVRVRSGVHKDAYAKAREIAVALDEDVYLTTVVVDDVSYLVWAVTRLGDPMFIGKDAPRSKRSLFAINAKVSLRAVTTLGYPILCEDENPLLLESGGAILLEGV